MKFGNIVKKKIYHPGLRPPLLLGGERVRKVF